MSYKQAVLRDDPIAYWPLTGTVNLRTYATILEEYNTYQQWLNTEGTYGFDPGSFYLQDVSVNQNQAAVAFGTELPVFQDIVTLNARLFGDTNYSGCKITPSSVISIFDIYDFFSQNYEEGVFGAEMWLQFPQNPTTNVNLFNVINAGNTIAQVYANNDHIYFTISGSTGTYTTKKQIHSWDQKIHLFITYAERSIQIMVNGISDETIDLPNNFQFSTTNTTYVKYQIGPAQTGEEFIINDLAFYTRKLSLNEIRNHLIWANVDSSPEYFVQNTSAYHIDLTENSNMIHLQKKFKTVKDYSQGVFNNLITDGGLTIQSTANAGQLTGTWYYNFPIVQYTNFAGTSISWDSGSNPDSTISSQFVSVSSSYDGGLTWNQVYSNQIVPNFLSHASTASSAQLLIRVQISSLDTSQALQPRLDNLSATIYKSLSVAADSGGFILSPASSQTYMIREDNNNILSKERNLGVHFVNQTPGSGTTGSAIIKSVNNTSYQTIEFWFRYESSTSTTLAAILDTTTVAGVDLYVNPSTSTLISNLGSNGSLYVNGFLQSSGQYTIVPGETYYVAITYNTSTSNPIYVNASADGTANSPQAMYGYFTLFPGILASTDIQNRYLSYISTSNSIVYDSVTTLGAISEYFGTSATSINGGVPVIAHNHIF